MMARRDRHDLKPSAALGVLLAVLIAVASAMLLVHWMACSQAAGTALCMGATAMPRWWHLRNQWGTWCRRLQRRWRQRWLTRRLAQAQSLVLSCKARQLDEAAARLQAEDRVAEIERTLHHLGRQP